MFLLSLLVLSHYLLYLPSLSLPIFLPSHLYTSVILSLSSPSFSPLSSSASLHPSHSLHSHQSPLSYSASLHPSHISPSLHRSPSLPQSLPQLHSPSIISKSSLPEFVSTIHAWKSRTSLKSGNKYPYESNCKRFVIAMKVY